MYVHVVASQPGILPVYRLQIPSYTQCGNEPVTAKPTAANQLKHVIHRIYSQSILIKISQCDKMYSVHVIFLGNYHSEYHLVESISASTHAHPHDYQFPLRPTLSVWRPLGERWDPGCCLSSHSCSSVVQPLTAAITYTLL